MEIPCLLIPIHNKSLLVYAVRWRSPLTASDVRTMNMNDKPPSLLDSTVHRKFREMTNGIDLTQFSMISLRQYEYLVNTLALSSGCRVLDLGCGVGRIAHSIFERTRGKISGIDLSPDILREGIPEFGSNIELVEGDFDDDLPWRGAEFDAIYSVDALYFSRDLPRLVGKIWRLLRPGGRFVVFWSQVLNDESDIQRLAPRSTDLAVALRENDIDYDWEDFSEEEFAHWRNSKNALITLEEEFRSENEEESFEVYRDETNAILERIAKGRVARYCYIARKEFEQVAAGNGR